MTTASVKFVGAFSVSLFLTVMSLYSQGYSEDALFVLLVAVTTMGILTSILILAKRRFGKTGDE